MRGWTVAGAAAALFVATTAGVASGATNGLDAALRQAARPDDVWGPLQRRVDLVVEGIRPVVVFPLLAAVLVTVCIVRRSVRPLVFGLGTAGVGSAALVAVKQFLDRPDPHGYVAEHGGSFPSGHTMSVIVCAGVALLMFRSGRNWATWVCPGLLGLAMATSLVVQAAHWVTDVVGGAALGVAVLGAVTATGWDAWARDRGTGGRLRRPRVRGPRLGEVRLARRL